MKTKNFFDRHRAKITFAGPDDCWLWNAGANNKGYGVVWARGKQRLAHREAYEAANGDGSADGFVIRHRCDTPLCVNPAHGEPGTQADNLRDMTERGRRAKGGAHGRARLTEADVVIIRSDYVRDSRAHGLTALAQRFGVSRAQVSRIIRRTLWADV